jgi:DNA-directed RNA polymerase subunit L
MNPSISNISVDDEKYNFTLSGVNVSVANALRRTILSDIPTTVIYTETYQDNQCKIDVNTTRLHNEIIKQRLSCIPIHVPELDILPDNYVLELDMKNDTDTMIIITTEDFKIKNKTNGNYLTKDQMREIFPPCPKTNMFIDFARIRPALGDVPGEHLKLSAEFSVHTAKENSMFNVVSICSYGNTIDLVKAETIWSELENKLVAEETTKKDIENQKKNYYLLDAHRQYIEDSFDYTVQSVGVYENNVIVKKGCDVLIKKLSDMIVNIESDIVPIKMSEVTMENSFDIVLENEDYTLGKLLEFILHDTYYEGEKVLSFCGFKKFHPHDDESVIRIAYKKPSDKNMVRMHLNNSCVKAKEIFEKIRKLF